MTKDYSRPIEMWPGAHPLPGLLRLIAFALAGFHLSVDLGLLPLRFSLVAIGISFEAIDPLPGTIEGLPHAPERLMASL
jgi:hypothetical protein